MEAGLDLMEVEKYMQKNNVLRKRDYERYEIMIPFIYTFGKRKEKFLCSELEKMHPCFSDEFTIDTSIKGITRKGFFEDVYVMNKLKLAEYERKRSIAGAGFFAEKESDIAKTGLNFPRRIFVEKRLKLTVYGVIFCLLLGITGIICGSLAGKALVFADEVIPVIRNVDSDAVILVGTPNWSSDLDSVVEAPLDYDNIMYTYHFYAGTHKSSARNTLTDALDAGLPVFISEYGFVSADGDGSVDTKEAAKWQDIIDEYQLSSCIWNLSNKAEGSALISSDCDKTADWEEEELSEQGQYFVNMLQSIDTSKQDDEEISDETSEDIKDKEQKLNQEKSNMEKKR